MRNWLKAVCLAAGATLVVTAAAKEPESGGAKAAAGVRPGTVVEIKPGRIILLSVAHAGDRLVAVGERGFAMLSDDAGKTWRAVGTPTTRTLTDVEFEDAKRGVAAGHGGSIVRTADGGESWTAVDVEQDAGVDSFLGVTSLGGGHFAAYGAFGLYMDSTDYGATWQRRRVISEEFENHISQVVKGHGVLGLVAEYGTLARSEDGGATWTEVQSPYTGSFFGAVVARDGSILTFGMRGKIFRSADRAVTWQAIETGTTQAFNGGTVLSDGRIVLVGNNGLIAESKDNGQTFRLAWSPSGQGFSDIAEVKGGGLVVVGERGASLLDPAILASK
jgi:photosystem II stability/assembly factor-like uncharacterized protein